MKTHEPRRLICASSQYIIITKEKKNVDRLLIAIYELVKYVIFTFGAELSKHNIGSLQQRLHTR